MLMFSVIFLGIGLLFEFIGIGMTIAMICGGMDFSRSGGLARTAG